MNNDLKFSIQNLLFQTRKGISGQMPAFKLAKDMAGELKFQFNRLARVQFEDETIHQENVHGELINHDTLIIGSHHKGNLWLSMWVKIGIGGLPVAVTHNLGAQCTITPAYINNAMLNRKLIAEEIQQVFRYVFENPSVTAVEKK